MPTNILFLTLEQTPSLLEGSHIMCMGMRMFTPHEKLVLARAINMLHLTYRDQHPHIKDERIASKGIQTVFKFKFPNLVDSSNIVVVFDDLMQRLTPGLRLEVAIWYIEDQEVGIPSERNLKDEDLQEFHTNLDIISQILRTNRPPTPYRDNKDATYTNLVDHWSTLKHNFFLRHL